MCDWPTTTTCHSFVLSLPKLVWAYSVFLWQSGETKPIEFYIKVCYVVSKILFTFFFHTIKHSKKLNHQKLNHQMNNDWKGLEESNQAIQQALCSHCFYCHPHRYPGSFWNSQFRFLGDLKLLFFFILPFFSVGNWTEMTDFGWLADWLTDTIRNKPGKN